MNFSRPSQLPTPPETDTDFLACGQHTVDLMNATNLHVADPDMNSHPSVGAPFRRVSTLAYHNSPLRDPRERSNVRQSRWLIVVIPPASLVQDHGPLGHTLTSGPTQRLSQGIVMPLQPTMYGQLTAIAREFNFPSPVGLCLYLHVTEHGFSMTPRISDDIWPTLWGHLFESRSPTPTFQMPICGRVEFDIDRRKALWLNSWLTSDRRHAVDVPVSVPPSLSHCREDSKNSFFDERGDERPEVLSALHTDSRGRHIPKKLSLVDRREALSLTSSVANAITGSGTVHALSNSLATALDGEAKPANIALEKRVESWRASSSVAPTPMATTDQINLDPEDIPDNIRLSDLDILADTEDGINLNDFAWSASSMGPPDYDPLESAALWSQVSSVHLDRRLEGSVLLSPSTATSWGPESLHYSPMSIPFRLPSPDIGQRVIEDCPPTPSTATSWGPEELLYSPESVKFRLPSPDLGQRMLENCPPTPITFTSWGPEELPRSAISVVSRLPPFNLDLITLCIWPHTPSVTIAKPSMSGTSGTVGPYPSSHVFPYLSAPSRPTWSFVWPLYKAENVSNPLPLLFPDQNLADDAFDVACLHFKIFPTALADPAGYPIHLMYIYPPAVQSRSATSLPVRLPPVYPTIELYPPQYPFITPYSYRAQIDYSSGHAPLYPSFDIYPAVAEPSEVGISLLPQVYPRIVLYPAVYPGLDLYPPVAAEETGDFPKTDLIPRCPRIRHADYPWFEIYPGHVSAGENDVATSRVAPLLQRVYPQFDIYPAVYPHFDIYGASSHKLADQGVSLSVMLPAQYPALNPYPAAYPHFEIFPPVIRSHSDLVPEHPTPVNERIPDSMHESVCEVVTSSPVPFFKRVRRTHRELHEEVFAAVKVSVEQALNKSVGGIQAQRPTSSRIANLRFALRQTASSPSNSPPPVPSLRMSKGPSPRMPSHNAEARLGGSSTPPFEVLGLPIDPPTSSHAQSNSLSSLNSSPRRDGQPKQSHRPRDSLILEKARHFEHVHTLPHGVRPSSVVDSAHLSVPPVPQLLHKKHPSA